MNSLKGDDDSEWSGQWSQPARMLSLGLSGYTWMILCPCFGSAVGSVFRTLQIAMAKGKSNITILGTVNIHVKLGHETLD